MSIARKALTAATIAVFGLMPGALVESVSAAEKPAATTTVTSCKAVYSLSGTWKGKRVGYTAALRIYNTGPTAITGWRLVYTYAAPAQKVTRLWAGTYRQSSRTVTVTPLAANTVIQPGKAQTIGFVAAGPHAVPSTVTLSGTACPETVSRGRVTAGVAASLGAVVEAQARTGQASGKTLAKLRHRVAQMKRDESRNNVKAEINHLRGFIREFHWPTAKTDVTPNATAALLGLANGTLVSLV